MLAFAQMRSSGMDTLFTIINRDQTRQQHRRKADENGHAVFLVNTDEIGDFIKRNLIYAEILPIPTYPRFSLVLGKGVGLRKFSKMTAASVPGLYAYKWIPHSAANYRQFQGKQSCTAYNEPCDGDCRGYSCVCVRPPGESQERCLGPYS